jgi:branched-subunit amino acid aminotransferase/4-amino-4-deoxychorismate lyase
MFEVVRVLRNGKPLGLDLHMSRLFTGASALDYSIPASRKDISDWITTASKEGGEGMVRVLLTRGSTGGSGSHLPGFSSGEHAKPSVVVMWQPLPKWPPAVNLLQMPAWWHPAGAWQTVKWLSYGPNMMMTRNAQKAGFDDALLTSENNVVLDGPTFAVGWFRKGILETPSSSALGLLPSCTLTLALQCARELKMPVSEGVFSLKDMMEAEEVFVTSSTKDVLPVSAVGDKKFPTGPLTTKLAEHFGKIHLA